MPEPSGDRMQIRAYFDTDAGRHKLEAKPETLRICKRQTRVVAIVAKNETANTEHYKPIILGYRIADRSSKTASRDPGRVFSDAPSFPSESFVVPDDGKPCYFMIKEHLGIEDRKTPCSFPDAALEYAVMVRFSHEGWDDAAGSGEHVDWHIES